MQNNNNSHGSGADGAGGGKTGTDKRKQRQHEEVETQQFSHDQLKDSIVGYNRREEDPGESAPKSRELRFRKPGKSPYRPLLVILVVVVICFLALVVIQMVRNRRNARVLENAALNARKPPAESEVLRSLRQPEPRVNDETRPRRYRFPNEVLQGEAPLGSLEGEPVFSRDRDPEVAAIVDAFNLCYRVIFDIRVVKRDGTITETCRGVFRGFGINSILVKRSGQAVKDEITLFTPSGGTLRVVDKQLDSVSRTGYEELMADLGLSGIGFRKEMVPEENLVRARLEFEDRWDKRPVDSFLIYGDGVGEVKLGMTVQEMKSILSGRYRILRRKIMVGNRFETILKVDDRQRTPLFFVYERNNRIWGIEVVHDRYKTQRGIGIGSTLGMVRVFYPDVNLVSIPAKFAYLFVDDSRHENIKFILLDDDSMDFQKEVFPFDLKINSVLVGRSPYLKD